MSATWDACQDEEFATPGLLAVVLLCSACAAPVQRAAKSVGSVEQVDLGPTRAPMAEGRPTVGVAFGGGSARGIAHVGVIRWLEEHHIPIDVAAGTSMGGLIGGAFATGMDAVELQESARLHELG